MESLIQFTIAFINIFAQLLEFSLFIWIILGWFSASKNNLGILLDQIIKPILAPFRWARIGMISLAPILAYLVIGYARYFLVTELAKLI